MMAHFTGIAVPLAAVLAAFPPVIASGDGTPSPTPTCNAQSISGVFSPQPPASPTYVPETTTTLTFQAISGTWPTDASEYFWQTSWGLAYDGAQTEQFFFPSPGQDDVWISVGAIGPGIRPECNGWFSTKVYRARRFDAGTPTPTPTPSPTPCPSPQCQCDPYPTPSCSLIYPPTYPKPGYDDVPTSFTLVVEAADDWLRLDVGNLYSYEPPYLGSGRYLVQGLPYNTGVVVNFVGAFTTCGAPVSCFPSFVTTSPPPTPTPSPTPVPSPTPAPPNGWMTGELGGGAARSGAQSAQSSPCQSLP